MIWGGIWLKYKFEWNRVLLTMALISGIVISMPAFEPQEDIIFTVTQISQNIINCNKLS